MENKVKNKKPAKIIFEHILDEETGEVESVLVRLQGELIDTTELYRTIRLAGDEMVVDTLCDTANDIVARVFAQSIVLTDIYLDKGEEFFEGMDDHEINAEAKKIVDDRFGKIFEKASKEEGEDIE